jgi:hypothetical protein
MTKEEVLALVKKILSNPNIKIVADHNVVEVYTNTYTGRHKEITIEDDTVDFDGVKYKI